MTRGFAGVLEALNARDAKYEEVKASKAKSEEDQRVVSIVSQWFNGTNIECEKYVADHGPLPDTEETTDELPIDVFVRKSLQEFQKLFLEVDENDFDTVSKALKTIFVATRPHTDAVVKRLEKNAKTRETNRQGIKKQKTKAKPTKKRARDEEDDAKPEEEDVEEQEEEERAESPVPMDEAEDGQVDEDQQDDEEEEEEKPKLRPVKRTLVKKLFSPVKAVGKK